MLNSYREICLHKFYKSIRKRKPLIKYFHKLNFNFANAYVSDSTSRCTKVKKKKKIPSTLTQKFKLKKSQPITPDMGINPTALRMAKTLCSFGSSECYRVKSNSPMDTQCQYNVCSVLMQLNDVASTYVDIVQMVPCPLGQVMPCPGVKMPDNQFRATVSMQSVNPIALRKAKILCNFGLSECNRVTKAKQDDLLKN